MGTEVATLAAVDEPPLCRAERRKHEDDSFEGYARDFQFSVVRLLRGEPARDMTRVSMERVRRLLNEKPRQEKPSLSDAPSYEEAMTYARGFGKHTCRRILAHVAQGCPMSDALRGDYERHAEIKKMLARFDDGHFHHVMGALQEVAVMTLHEMYQLSSRPH